MESALRHTERRDTSGQDDYEARPHRTLCPGDQYERSRFRL